MGKMKTHTGTGKLRRFKAYKGHLTGKKTAKRTRNLRKGSLVSTADVRRIDNMIP